MNFNTLEDLLEVNTLIVKKLFVHIMTTDLPDKSFPYFGYLDKAMARQAIFMEKLKPDSDNKDVESLGRALGYDE